MKDRIPANPGRVLITPESGGAPYYAKVTRADNPTQEGTPLNKNTLLKDATAAMFGLDENAVPDDAISAIKILIDGANANANTKAKIETGSYTGTGKYGRSNPCSLTFDFVPKVLFLFTSNTLAFYYPNTSASYVMGTAVLHVDSLTTNYTQTAFIQEWDAGKAFGYAKRNGNAVYWYGLKKADAQYNYSGIIYNYIVIG